MRVTWSSPRCPSSRDLSNKPRWEIQGPCAGVGSVNSSSNLITMVLTTSPSLVDFFHDATLKCLKTFTNGCCHTEMSRQHMNWNSCYMQHCYMDHGAIWKTLPSLKPNIRQNWDAVNLFYVSEIPKWQFFLAVAPKFIFLYICIGKNGCFGIFETHTAKWTIITSEVLSPTPQIFWYACHSYLVF
jgi:hypothetical protein